MALTALKKLGQASDDSERFNHEEDMRRDAAREETFRRKIAIQQFMNHNGPLFRAFAQAGTPITELVEGEVLRVPASEAMRLATLVAASVLDKPADQVTAADAKPFRTEAAEWVAQRWLAKRPLEVEAAAAEIASAVSLADGSWDHDAFRDDRISNDASLMITAAGVTGTLARQVDIYDFRLGKEVALSRLVKAIVETSSNSARDMLPPEASVGDIRNLTQTLARNLASLMEACYERRAREVVKFLDKKPTSEKQAWYAQNKPLDEVLLSFKEWTVCFGGFAIAASRDMSAKAKPDVTNTRKSSG